MKNLLIVGAGGYGQLVKEIAEMNGYTAVDFLDDNSKMSVGKICDLQKLQSRYDGCIVAIGNADIRKQVSEQIANLVTLIHPRAVISTTASIGDGCVIEANAVVSSNASVGRASYVCAGAVVNHNAFVSDYCQVDCNAVVTVGTIVPEGTKIPSGSVWSVKIQR